MFRYSTNLAFNPRDDFCVAGEVRLEKALPLDEISLEGQIVQFC
jgi:hypothetical protein